MSEPLDYEALVAAFEHSLLTQLRGHSAAAPFLETWVPDEDPVLGLLNMFEAAEIAGESAIAVRVGRRSLPPERLPEIRAHAAEFGILSVIEEGNAWLLQLSEIGRGQLLRRIAPAFRETVGARLGRSEYAGNLIAGAGQQLLSAEADGFVLSILVDPASRIILGARHGGRSELLTAAVLDHLCAVITGTTPQEAADHAGHHLITRLTAPGQPRPVSGILLPRNADPIFGLPNTLVRALLSQWRILSGDAGRENEFTTAPDSAWARQAPEQRQIAVAAAVEAGAPDRGLPAGAVKLVAMERNILGQEVRAVVSFAADVAAEDKPGLARKAEQHLKQSLDPHLELYVEELKDQNVIRRL